MNDARKIFIAMTTGHQLMKGYGLEQLSNAVEQIVCNSEGCTLSFNRAVTADEADRVGRRLAEKNLIGEDQAFEVCGEVEIFIPIHTNYLNNIWK